MEPIQWITDECRNEDKVILTVPRIANFMGHLTPSNRREEGSVLVSSIDVSSLCCVAFAAADSVTIQGVSLLIGIV